MPRPKRTLRTSYFSAGELILASGLAAVRISVGNPRWHLPYPLAGACRLLMPTRDMLELDYDEYRLLYRGILEEHGVTAIREDLRRISEEAKNPGLVLLCFESLRKPDQWCHRTIFAEWWTEKTREAVIELG